jgi:hypothetical protein
MIGMPIRQHGTGSLRLMTANARDGLLEMIRILADAPIGPAQVFTPRGAKRSPRLLRLGQPFVGRSVAGHLARREIAQADRQSERRVLRDNAANADLDVVGMRTEYKEVKRHWR